MPIDIQWLRGASPLPDPRSFRELSLLFAQYTLGQGIPLYASRDGTLPDTSNFTPGVIAAWVRQHQGFTCYNSASCHVFIWGHGVFSIELTQGARRTCDFVTSSEDDYGELLTILSEAGLEEPQWRYTNRDLSIHISRGTGRLSVEDFDRVINPAAQTYNSIETLAQRYVDTRQMLEGLWAESRAGAAPDTASSEPVVPQEPIEVEVFSRDIWERLGEV